MKQGLFIQKVLRRFLLKSCAALTLFFSAGLSADQVVPCASQVICGEVGKIQISTQGTEKILEMSLDAVADTVDIKGELNRVLANSPHFPHTFNLGNPERLGMKATVDNLKFDALSFGASQVNIKEREVQVCVPVEEMDLKVDAEFDIWGNKLGQKGASARIKRDAPSKPEICFNGEVSADGNFSDLIAIPWEEPEDVGEQSKRALLDVDLTAASSEEVLFSYLTLYAMEGEEMELPTKFEWGKLWDLMGDFSPENAQKFFDIEDMRKKLVEMKGGLPPLEESASSKVGLRNYLGNMEVDLNLENNGNTVVKDDRVWDDIGKLLNDPVPEREIPPDEGGIMSFIKGAAHNMGHKLLDAGEAAKRGMAGVGNRLTMRGEEVLRERFLPYLQEKFNQNATQNPPVMTAIAKSAEKELIPLARKHANQALEAARRVIQQENLARSKAHLPGFNLQDVVDGPTLRTLEERLGPQPLQNLVLNIDAVKTQRDYNLVRNQALRLLDDLEAYADAITGQSTDERAHRFLQSGLGNLATKITNFLGNKNGGLDDDFLRKREQVLSKLMQKEQILAHNIAHKRDVNAMELIPKLMSERSGGPEVALTFPELCEEGLGEMDVSLPNVEGSDATTTVSVAGINAMLKRMHSAGSFNFCLYGTEARTCGSSANFDHKCHMNIPPQLAWDGIKGKHQLLLNGVKCESRFINAESNCGIQVDPEKSFFHALAYPFSKLIGGSCKLASDLTDQLVTGGVGQNKGQVAIDIEPRICGKSICFDTALAGVDVSADLDSISPSLKGVAGLITAVASPVTNVVKTQIVDERLMNFLENDVSRPLEAPVGVVPKRIQSRPESISIYADFERTPVVESVMSACLEEVSSCPERFF